MIERSKVRQAEVSDEEAGLRLDKYLAKALPEVPWSHVFRLIRKGEVRVNAKRAQGSLRLQAGDIVRVHDVAGVVDFFKVRAALFDGIDGTLDLPEKYRYDP